MSKNGFIKTVEAHGYKNLEKFTNREIKELLMLDSKEVLIDLVLYEVNKNRLRKRKIEIEQQRRLEYQRDYHNLKNCINEGVTNLVKVLNESVI